MAMNKQRRTANLNNVLTYDSAGNSTLIANLTVEGLTGAGFVKADVNGLLSVDINAYITLNSGLTGFTVGAATEVTAADTVLQAFGKIQGQLNAIPDANVITGTGVTGQVAYWSGTNTQAGSNNLFFNTTTGSLGVGTNTTGLFAGTNRSLTLSATGATQIASLEIQGNRGINQTAGILSFYNNTDRLAYITGTVGANLTSGTMLFLTHSTGVANEVMRLTSAGNLHIGAFTSESTQRLQVTGDTLMKGSGATSATTALTVQNSSSSDLLNIRNDGSIFLTSNTGARIYPSIAISGVEIGATGLAFDGRAVTRTAASSSFWFFVSNNSTAATQSLMNFGGGFTPTSGTATWNSTLINTTINQTGGANGITRGLYVNPTLTAAADWRSIEWSNNTGWGLYGAGTANNFLSGNTGFFTTTPLTKVHIRTGQAASTLEGLRLGNGSNDPNAGNRLSFYFSDGASNIGGAFIDVVKNGSDGNMIFSTSATNGTPTEKVRIFGDGNFGINTGSTNSGQRLQVTGTALITGAVTLSNLAGAGTRILVTDASGNLSTQPTSTYLTSLTGEATNSGTVVTLTNSAVIGKVLTGVNISSGSITASDSVLSAIGKLQGQINGLQGGTVYKGAWNASTNTPTITSSVGTLGNYYVVTTAGTTNINGISSWAVGDWIIFNGTVWEKIPNVDSITSVNGQYGAVVLTTANITESGNLYYTDTRARNAISLTTTGTSGAATYGSGVLNIPNYSLAGLGGVATSRTLIINGTALDLSADRSWLVGTVTSITAGTYLTGGTITGTGTITVDATTTNTASKVVARDGSGNFAAGTITASLTGNSSTATTWQSPITITIGSTGKSLNGSANVAWSLAEIGAQQQLTLTTTGSSGASTLSSGVLNVPNYTLSGLGGISGSGTTNYIPKFTSSTNIGNSIMTESSGIINIYGIGQIYTSQASSGQSDFYISNEDTAAAITHQTRIATQQLGSGLARTLIYASAYSTNKSRGELSILSENGSQFIANFGTQTTSGDNAFSLYSTSAIENIRLNTGGSSWLNGGNVGINQNSPTEKLDIVGNIKLSGYVTGGSWQGTAITPAYGGTGATTLTGIVIGNGTSTMTAVSGTAGQLLRRNAGNTAYEFFTASFIDTSRTITINGTTQDLSANRTYSVGTVTSVALSVPTGLSIGGSPITTSGTLAITLTAGYSIPTTTKQSEWDSAYTNRITSLTTTGNSGSASLISNTLNIPTYTLVGLGGMSNPFSASIGQLIYSNSAGAPLSLAPNTTTTRKYLSMLGDGTSGAAPTWETITGIAGSGTTGYISKFTGASTIGNSLLSETSNVLTLGFGGAGTEYGFEIGNGRTGNGFAYIDLVGDVTYTDYGMRLIRGNSGANTESTIEHRGTGALILKSNDAGAIINNVNGSNRTYLDSVGNYIVGTGVPSARFHVSGGTLATGGNGFMVAANITNGRLGTYDAGSCQAIHTYFDAHSYELSAGSTSGYVSGIAITGRNASLLPDRVAIYTRSVQRLQVGGTGQLRLNAYTSASSFTGTPVGYLAFDSSGNIISSNPDANQERYFRVAFSAELQNTWIAMPAALNFFDSSRAYVTQVDISSFNQVRLVVNKQGVSGAANSKILLRYQANSGAPFTESSYLQIGVTEVSVNINTTDTILTTSWINLEQGAYDDVFIALMGSGGDGTSNPVFGNIYADFRYITQQN